jgi:hypothetical protein
MVEEAKESSISIIDVEETTAQEETKKGQQNPGAKAAWAALFGRPKTSSDHKKGATSTAENLKQLPAVKIDSQENQEDVSNNQSESSILRKRKHGQGHAVGWDDAYLVHPLFSSWIRLDCDAGLVFCDVCIKHKVKPPTFGKGKASNFIVGVNASTLRLDVLKRHMSEGTSHQIAMEKEKLSANPDQNLEGVVKNMSKKQKEDLITLFDTALVIAKWERPLADYPRQLQYLQKNSNRVIEFPRYRDSDGCKSFIKSMAEDITAKTVRDIRQCGCFSLLSDDSNDRNSETCTDIHVRYIDPATKKTTTKFLILVSLDANATAYSADDPQRLLQSGL